MKMKKICQGAVIFTVLHAQASAFAEPQTLDAETQKDPTIEESQSESESSLLDLILPDVVLDLVNRNALDHSGNQPIC